MRSVIAVLALAACDGQHSNAVVDATVVVPDVSSDAPAGSHRGLSPISYQGGHVLSSMRLVVITAPAHPLATQLFDACDVLVASSWWSAVTGEYGLGPPRGCVHVTGDALATPSTLTDGQMTAYIANAIAASATPIAPDGQTM